MLTNASTPVQGAVIVEVALGKTKYLFVYPFVRTPEWYLLSKEIRQSLMDENTAISRKYPSVKIHTFYSLGVDNQEFMVAFESNAPMDCLDLTMELRESEATRYTLRDIPTFTCMAMGVWRCLMLWGDKAVCQSFLRLKPFAAAYIVCLRVNGISRVEVRESRLRKTLAPSFAASLENRAICRVVDGVNTYA